MSTAKTVLGLTIACAFLAPAAARADSAAAVKVVQVLDDGRVRVVLVDGAHPICTGGSLTSAERRIGEIRISDASAEAVEGVRSLAVAALLSGRQLKLFDSSNVAYSSACRIGKVELQ